MTSLIGARKRAEEFAAALEGEVAWSEVHPELADLAVLVDDLCVHDPVEPSPEFTASLRERLLAEADQLHTQDAVLTLPERRRGRRERRFAIAASALVFVGGTAGMAAAAQQALPGDALYPIKRGLENAQAGLAGNDASKGRDLLDQANTRLTEIQQMIDGSSNPGQLPPTINAFTSQSVSGAHLLMKSYKQDHSDPKAIADVREFTTRNLSILQKLAQTAPADQQEELTRAAMALVHIDAKAVDTCRSCAPGLKPLQMPKLLVPTADATRALARVANHPSLSNDHQALDQNQLPAPSTERQPVTGDSSGAGSGDTQQQLPGLPSGGTGSTSGGSTSGDGGTGGPVRKIIKDVTGGGGSDGTTTKDNTDPGSVLKDLLN